MNKKLLETQLLEARSTVGEIMGISHQNQEENVKKDKTLLKKNLVTELNELIDEHSYMIPPEEYIQGVMDVDDKPLAADDGSFLLIKASIFKTLVEKAIDKL